ncbi:MAG: hypothetical protein IJ362_06130, partial [Oscillospiraceae bacterium]|nr:hypothetical protein [Oscillospiraceae bacterium]
GYIPGSGLFYTPMSVLRGLFRHEMMQKFAVIVAAQADFRKYKAKRAEYPRKYCEMICFLLFQPKYTSISVVFSWNG